MTTDRCPACSRPLEDVGPLPAGSVRLCPCRLRNGLRRRLPALLRVLARLGPLPAWRLRYYCFPADTAAVAALLDATPGVVRDGKTYRLEDGRP